MKVLVVGSGSIGRRHIRNLRSLGVRDLWACDPDPERLVPVIQELGVGGFAGFDEALEGVTPNVVFICTPPVLHVDQAMRAINAGSHVFIEKPLSHSLVDVDELITRAKALQRVVQVGYNLRFHPGLQRVKELVDLGSIGRILWARAEFGQYLPDWRPWQDYRDSYTTRRDLGGGIILDGSHELDYIMWLLGQPIEVVCMAGKVSDMEVDVEDCATVLVRFANGAQADVHMDFVQREYARWCKLAGEKGTIAWDYAAHGVRVYRVASENQETEYYAVNSNDMYVAEVRHFFDCIREGVSPIVDLEQAKMVLKVALGAKAAAMRGCLEPISS